MPSDRPVVFLAFADSRKDLPTLTLEGWSIRDQFEILKQDGVIADLVVEEKAQFDRICRVFRTHRDRIALFHFGGHADENRLLLHSYFEPRPAYPEGLASLLGDQRGLKLVFLNACSTRPQVHRLFAAGVPAVIATASLIKDEVATEFAVAFYQALTTGLENPRDKKRTIPRACSLERAFSSAQGYVKGKRRGTPRDLVKASSSSDDSIDNAGFPWTIQYAPGSEHLARWTLFEDDPLYGLPNLSADIGWPVVPYRNLESFRREDARIFFGRGRAIRETYNLLTLSSEAAESRLIFYYGQTGVGKTSVLAAGLLPRLEGLFETRYCRRSVRHGLLGTLHADLAPRAKALDLRKAWLKIEHKAKVPLLIVLDQAEEAFTRPLADSRPADEVRALFGVVREVFASTRVERPRGRLILSFRKEWLAEFDELRKASQLDVKAMMLDPLDRRGVIEAIEGPADHFGLVISPDRNSAGPGEPSLTESMADGLFDTLANPQTEQESPIAPTLQSLLARMWKEADDRMLLQGQARRTFNRELYQGLKDKAFRLDEVIQEQFESIAAADERMHTAVEKGLLLDILVSFTTRESTARARTKKEMHDRYPRQAPELIDALLEACKNAYLLADAHKGPDGTTAYRLTHDTLAPLVRERFQRSLTLVPRARRALEQKGREWLAWHTEQAVLRTAVSPVLLQPKPLLEAQDLSYVEEAQPYLCEGDSSQQQLLMVSREADRLRREELDEAREGRLRAMQEALAQTAIASRRAADVLTGGGLLAQQQGESFKAMHLFAQSIAAVSQEPRSQALNRIRLDRSSGWVRPRLHAILEGHSDTVRYGSFNHAGDRVVTTSRDKTARLWDARSGALLATFAGHDDDVRSASFDSSGARVVTASSDHSVRIWDAETGSQIALLEGHERGVLFASFANNDTTIVSFDGNTALMWDLGSHTPISRTNVEPKAIVNGTVAYNMILTGSDGDSAARVWDGGSGSLLRTLEGHRGDVTSAAFGHDGSRVVTSSTDGTARIWDLDTAQVLASLQRHTGWVNSAVFNGDDTRVLTSSADGTARIWDAASATPIASLQGHTDNVLHAAFSKDGRLVLTSSADGTARIWDVGPVEPIAIMNDRTEPNDQAIFSPDGSRVLTTSHNGAQLWETASGRCIGRLREALDWVDSATFNSDGKLVLTVSRNLARAWDGATGSLLRSFKANDFVIHCAQFCQASEFVITASSDGAARIWAVGSAELLATLEGHDGAVRFAAFNRAGDRVLILSERGPAYLWVWDGRSCQLLTRLGINDFVTASDFSPGGDRIATLARGGTARIWDAASGGEVAVMEKLEYPVGAGDVLLSQDNSRLIIWGINVIDTYDTILGRRILSTGGGLFFRKGSYSPKANRIVTIPPEDKTARVWDVQSGTLVSTLEGHLDMIRLATFNHDGDRVITVSTDRTARVWDAETGALIAMVSRPEGVDFATLNDDPSYMLTMRSNTHSQLVRAGRLEGYSISGDSSISIWPLRGIDGAANLVPLWVEAWTGTAYAGGGVLPLSKEEWLGRRTRLEQAAAGGTAVPLSPNP